MVLICSWLFFGVFWWFLVVFDGYLSIFVGLVFFVVFVVPGGSWCYFLLFLVLTVCSCGFMVVHDCFGIFWCFLLVLEDYWSFLVIIGDEWWFFWIFHGSWWFSVFCGGYM